MGLTSLSLATLNMRGLKNPRKYARLLGELSNLRVQVPAVQETHFICAADCRVLENDINIFSVYGCRSSAGVSLLVGRSLDADVNVVLLVTGAGWLWPMLPLKISNSGWLLFMRPIPLWRGFPFFVGWHRS